MTRTRHVPRWRRMLPVIAAVAVGVPLLGVATMLLMSKPDVDRHHMIRQVTVLRLPPPPPPPPEQKPPEPPKMKEEVKIETPRPQEQPPQEQSAPPPGPLGLDAQGSGPGDAFGLAGRPGGRDIVLGGGGPGTGELAAMAFGNGAARHIAQELARNPALKGANFRIEIYVWLTKDGRFEREEIARGSGNAELDARIRDALTQVSPLRQPMPSDLAQPLRIRVTSSDA